LLSVPADGSASHQGGKNAKNRRQATENMQNITGKNKFLSRIRGMAISYGKNKIEENKLRKTLSDVEQQHKRLERLL
jgi:hypothetical protein